MKRSRRFIAAVLAAVLTYSIFFGLAMPSFAADAVNISVNKFENGTVDLKWTPPGGTRALRVLYHTPDDPDEPRKIVSTTTLDKVSISGLEPDYIYDIRVELYDSDALDGSGDPSGTLIGEGLLYYLPRITFYSSAIAQDPENMSGGGLDSGKYPKLRLRWKIPSIWNGVDAFVPANSETMLTRMQNELRSVYNDTRTITAMNFRINFSPILNNLNGGASSIEINQIAGTVNYTADMANSPGNDPAHVLAEADGFMSFELWGRSDADSQVPTIEHDNSSDPNYHPYALAAESLYPGSVYYMNIKPSFTQTPFDVSNLKVGDPEDNNGSLLSGPVSYAYTPIRFQLTKDGLNNIYVKTFRINQGSLDLPQLYYEVQSSDDPTIEGDWEVKASMIDSNFSGGFAITIIQGVDPSADVYYKIVVKSESPNDRLESLKMLYTLKDDSNRPPLPTNITVTNRVLQSGSVTTADSNYPTITVKSTNVTITWDKPLGWDDPGFDKNSLYFHFLLSTSQTNMDTPVKLYADGTVTSGGTTTGVRAYLGEFKPEFRLVRYINGGDLVEEGNRLSLTINGINGLFTWDKQDGTSGTIDHDAGYPEFLLPNTVYYLQMYTTLAANAGEPYDSDVMSDKSIITSFTTLSSTGLDVPLPMSLALNANGKMPDTDTGSEINYIDLTFDKVTSLDWSDYFDTYDTSTYSYGIYYDIYASPRPNTETFIKIGTTENPNTPGNMNVEFTGADDPTSTSVKARISKFTETDARNLFGSNLLPNTTYYFKIKTRLKRTELADSTHYSEKSSEFTAILPVTTIVISVNPPDDNQRKPLAPTDFAIAVNEDGDQELSGNSVTFTWKRQEDDVVYQLIRTSRKVNPTDGPGTYGGDAEYASFLRLYDKLSDGDDTGAEKGGKVFIDPAPGAGGHATGPQNAFSYDPATKTCTYTVNLGMFPNKLYYFSLKAVRITRTGADYTPTPAESVWVSIPVTTLLIEQPSMLEVVNGAELGFFWTDTAAGMVAEDYTIYIKGPGDLDYKPLTRTGSTIVKDNDVYYGRVFGLKTNSSYDIKVYKGGGTGGVLVYEKLGMQTRDGYHELEIKWLGNTIDSFSSYEIAIMAEGSSEYTILTGNDLEYYFDKNGRLLPYYTEETPMTVVDNNSLYYHAKIKKALVELPGGLTSHQPLRSNVKYYIKVRAVKVDSADETIISYSKYAGPVSTRTEFNQDDYDNTDREEKQEAIFLDRMKELEQGYYWRVDIGSSTANRILLKGDRVVNALQSLPDSSFTVDLTSINVNMDKDEVYMPLSVVRAMNSLNKSLEIRTPGADYLLRPGTLDVSDSKQIKDLLARPAVRDLYVRLTATRSDAAPAGLPSNGERASRINDLEIQAVGSSKTDSELKELFHDRLYNKDTGLVSSKLNILQNTYIGTGADAARLMDEYTRKMIEAVESELSVYIQTTIEQVRLPGATQSIVEFASPISASLSVGSKQGTKVPYVLYDGAAAWQKVANSTQTSGKVTINVLKTGKYTVLVMQGALKDVPDGHWAKDQIAKLTSKYDLSDVFSGIGTSFMPDNRVSCREVILLYEKVTGRTSANTGLDIKQKTRKLGLDGLINPNNIMKNIKRQETAAVLLKLFAVKKGVSPDSLRPGGNIYINDEDDIDSTYYNSVLMIIDMGVMNTDNEGNFLPGGSMTRAEVAAAFVKILELTGDLQ